MLVDMAAGATRAQSGLRDSSYAIRFKRSGLSERRDKARVASYLVCAPQLLGVASLGGCRIDTRTLMLGVECSLRLTHSRTIRVSGRMNGASLCNGMFSTVTDVSRRQRGIGV